MIENQKSEMILRLNLTSNQIGTDVMEFGQIMESRGHQSTGKLKMTEFSIIKGKLHLTYVGNTQLSNFTCGQS